MEYEDRLHAMQAGVAEEMQNPDSHETEPKHLRVGINAAMCDHAALVRLLMNKGLITNDDYISAITKEMDDEVKRYENKISKRMGGAEVELV